MFSIGAQWAVLQSAAWVGMAVSYSLKERSVTQGLSQTFDGRHPCALCKVVTKSKQTEKKDPTENIAKLKLDLFCNAQVIFATVPVGNRFPHAENQEGSTRLFAPPVPPPRGAAPAAV